MKIVQDVCASFPDPKLPFPNVLFCPTVEIPKIFYLQSYTTEKSANPPFAIARTRRYLTFSIKKNFFKLFVVRIIADSFFCTEIS